jgi:uncharacterized protein
MDVGVEANVYAGDPEGAFGLRSDEVRVPDELGPMPAWSIPGRGDTWALVVHGINGTPQEGLRLVPTLHRAGLPTLLTLTARTSVHRRARTASTTWV